MTRPKIKPVRRIARAYVQDDQRFERNSRIVDPADMVKSSRTTRTSSSGSSTDSGQSQQQLSLMVSGSDIGDSSEVDFTGSGSATVSGFRAPGQRKLVVNVNVPYVTPRPEILKMIAFRG